MEEPQGHLFTDSIEERLPVEEGSQTLWVPVAHEFHTGGPDAAKEYLDAERQSLEERVLNLLAQIEGVS